MVSRFAFIRDNKSAWTVAKRKDGPWMQYADHEQALAEKDAAYQQLMAQAVRFAEIIRNDRECTYGGAVAAHQASLVYRAAQAFLKERGK